MKTKIGGLIRSTKSQWYLMVHKKGFWFSFWIMLLANAGIYLLNARSMMGKDVFSIPRSTDFYSLMSWGEAASYLIIFFPFLMAFPAAFSAFDEERGKNSAFGILRSSYGLYYAGKGIASFLAGCMILWVPTFLNIFWNAITFRVDINGRAGMLYSEMYFDTNEYFLHALYQLHPVWYVILFTFFAGIFAGICCFFCYSVSNYIKKFKILCVLPLFILFFVTRNLSIEGCVLDEYLICPIQSQKVPYMIVFEMAMLLVSIFLLWRYTKKKEFL